MGWLRVIPLHLPLRLRSLVFRRQVEDELRAELQYHLDREIEVNLSRGMDPDEARHAALRAMGGLEQRKEACRDTWRVAFVDQLGQDLRYGARVLRKRPLFTLVAVLSLGFGIGVNTAVFSFVNTLLLTKLPVRDADRLYELIVTHRTSTGNAFSYTNYQKLRTAFEAFEDVVAWFHRDFDLEVNQSRSRVHGAVVTGNFYQFLGIEPTIGRLIEPSDDSVGNAMVAVLGYDFWRRQFAGNPEVLGQVIRVEGAPFTVIGVTPPAFGGAEIDNPRDVILPVHAVKHYDPSGRTLEHPAFYLFSVLVRLKPGVTLESTRPMLRDRWPQLDQWESQAGSDDWQTILDIQPGGSGVSRVRAEFSQALLVVTVLVALVLLITCANLANLLLARAVGRRRETAMRLAIGANRSRLIRQSLTESVLLAVMGGCAGILLASWMARWLLVFLPQNQRAFLTFQLDPRMLLFATGVTATTALLFGLLPAFQAVRVPLNVAMSEGGRTPQAGRRRWISQAVVVAQVSVCLALVVTALLFARSLEKVASASLGFELDSLLLLDLNPVRAGIRGEQNDLVYKRILDELNATPGIVAASCARVTPLSGSQWWDAVVVPGYVPARSETTTIYMNQVSPGYFRTLGIPILEGRDFTAADDKRSRRVAIVGESFARRFFPGQQAVGQVFNTGTGAAWPNIERYAIFRDLEIIGVAADTKYRNPHEDQKDLIYLAAYQAGLFDITGAIVLRLAPGVGLEQGARAVRTIVSEAASGLPVEIRPYSALFERSLQRDRMVAVLSGLFGLLGLALACVGLYGVLAQAVMSRTSEIGLRMTLGARRWQVEWLVLRETLVLLALGSAIGVPLAVGFGRFASSLLYGVKPTDPAALLASLGVMASVCLVASWLPARRAARIDPMMALRHE